MYNAMAVSNTWIIGCSCAKHRVIQSYLVFAWSALKVGSFGLQNHPVLYVIHKMFLLYINDLPTETHSHIRLFADDAILYIKIKSNADCTILQEDLNRLANW